MKQKLLFLCCLLLAGGMFAGQSFALSGKVIHDNVTQQEQTGENNNHSCFVLQPQNQTYLSKHIANKFTASIFENIYLMQPANEKDNWNVQLQLKSIGKDKQQLDVETVNENKVFVDKLHIIYPEFIIEYINNYSGIRQNFIINKPMDGNAPIIVSLALNTSLKPSLKGNNSVLFSEENQQTGDVKDVLLYKDLLAYDANGKVLASEMKLVGNEIQFIVNDDDAVYPITIDPLSTTPDWNMGNSLDHFSRAFGSSVSSAGDVNGDGFDDAIIGANGNSSNMTNAAAYLFYGSPSGLLLDTAWRYLSSNYQNIVVKGIGDVNGDNYSDIAISLPEIDSGRVMIYLGSEMGLGHIPHKTYKSVYSAPEAFGASISGAGDLNNDGYSDFMIACPNFNSGNLDTALGIGRVLLYLGSPAGLGDSANQILYGVKGSSLNFGFALSHAGDANGDGYSDIVITDPYYNAGSGYIKVFYGTTNGVSLSNITYFISGSGYSEQLGIALASAGDVNADGYSDIVVGAPSYGSSSEGRIYILYGTFSGIDTVAKPYNYIDGAFPNYNFGKYLSGFGDVNGDGYADFGVGADMDLAATGNYGSVRVYYGTANGIVDSVMENYGIDGYDSACYFGSALSSAGDVNGDGFADILVGAHSLGVDDNGGAFAYYGAADMPADTAMWSQMGSTMSDYGASVNSAGDVNGDGFADVVVGIPGINSYKGAVVVYTGDTTGLSETEFFYKEGDTSFLYYGKSVNTAGDVNSDGYSDIIVGGPGEGTGLSKVHIYAGGPTSINTDPIWQYTDTNSGFGTVVAPAGDVNGDGYPDIIVTAPYFTGDSTMQGKIYVFYGSAGIMDTIPDWTYTGIHSEEMLGIAAATAGDVNGDGYSDIIVGSHLNLNNQGAAYVFYGSPGGLSAVPDWQNYGSADNDQYGAAVASAGDVNGDGFADVIIGAPNKSFGQAGKGEANLYLGASGGLNTTLSWQNNGMMMDAYFGNAVSSAGDVNGDGYADIVIGSKGYEFGSGRAYIYFGADYGIDADTVHELAINEVGNFGSSVAAAGDVNGDGFSDVIASAPNASGSGMALVFSGVKDPGFKNQTMQYNATTMQRLNSGALLPEGNQLLIQHTANTTQNNTMKMQYQITTNGNNFNNTVLDQLTPPTLVLNNGQIIEEAVNLPSFGAFKYRLRNVYNKANAINMPSKGRWTYPSSSLSDLGNAFVRRNFCEPVVITTSLPAATTAMEGSSPAFAVTHSGTPPFTYKWYFNGEISGYDSIFIMPSITLMDSGYIYCQIANGCSSVSTDSMHLTIRPQFVNKIGMQGVTYGNAAWGDYNNDGRLDLVIAGEFEGENPNIRCKIFKNENDSTFDLQTDTIFGGLDGNVVWNDFDKDGYLDFVLCGDTNVNVDNFYPVKIYRNLYPVNNFQEVSVTLPSLAFCAADWGDYDNDGDADLLLMGNYSIDSSKTYLYKNNFPALDFSLSTVVLPAAAAKSVKFADMDKDGLLDIILSGDTFVVMRNMGNEQFTPMFTMPFMNFEDIAIADYNNDGKLDIAVNEQISGTPIIRVFYNEGGGNFTNAFESNFPACSGGGMASGDYNNNGFSDIFATGEGYNASPQPVIVFNNLPDSTFAAVNYTALSQWIFRSSVAVADYNNDGNLDVHFSGYYDSNYYSNIYQNLEVTSNTPPTAPTNLTSNMDSNSVWLHWNMASDDHTPSLGLSYNLRIGTTPGAIDVVSPMALSNGTRLVAALGNAGTNTSFHLKNLQPGVTYYWSVQAIDGAYKGSPFSAEHSFSICQPVEITASNLISMDEFCIGEQLNLIVAATGTEPITYQWYQDNVPLPLASDDTLIINNLAPAAAGNYYCIISNSCGSDTSITEMVVINEPATIMSQNNDTAICVGGSHNFMVFSTGTPLPNHQWYYQNSPISGQTGSILGLSNIQLSDTGYYYCIAQNTCGSDTSQPVYLNVITAPTVITQPQDVAVCLGQTATFDVITTVFDFTTYQWYKLNGAAVGSGMSVLILPQVSYSDTGYYYCAITNSCGVTYSDTVSLSIINPLQASFNFSVIGNIVSFTNTSAPFQYCLWNFGDGQGSNENHPVHTYLLPGVYNVCLTIYNDTNTCGIVDMYCAEVVVQPGQFSCNANFTYQTIAGNQISFNSSTSTGTNLQYYWNLGDAQNSYDANPLHTYPASGYYPVTLTVRNQLDSCIDSETQLIYVGDSNANTSCEAQFTYYNNTNNATVNFFDQSLGNNLKYYLWNFGDNTISTDKNPVHTYVEAGYYAVCLTVSDSFGTCVNMSCQTINVGNNSNALWMLFNYLPDTTGGKAVGSVEFRGAAYGDPSRVIWTFGDSTLDSNTYVVSHTYQNPGYYMVSFQGNNQNVVNTAYQLVNVAAGTNALQCRFGYTQAATNKKAAGSVEFRGAAYGDPSRCVWTFGDGDGDTTTLYPNHIYDTTGLYYVCLTVTNTNTQQTHTYCQWIEVTDTTIGIHEKSVAENKLLKVYPNPAQDKVYMQFEVAQKDMPFDIVITDLAGRMVHRYSGSTEAAGIQLLEWNCKHIPAGSYVIHFSSAALQTNQKLLITK